MSNEKEKTKVGKFLQKVIPVVAQLIKGQIKSIPFAGNLIVDGIEIITKKDIGTGAPKTHNKFVYAIELVGALTISYMVITEKIPVDKLIEFIKGVV